MHFQAATRWLLQLLPLFTSAQSVVSLDGDSWTLSNPSKAITIPAKVPGDVILDLKRAEVVGEPLYGLNEFNLRWVANDTWIYASPSLSDLLNTTNVLTTYLIFDGLDTFATIQVCGKTVGSTDNQFRQYTYDISTNIQNCNTTSDIVVSFQPATQAAVLAVFAAANGSCANFGCIALSFEFPGISYIRKEQYDFGWDFAPGFGQAGIWKSVRVVQLPKPAIHVQNTWIDVYRQGQINNLPPDQSQPWVVNASIDYIGILPSGSSVELKIYNTTNSLQIASFSTTSFQSNNTNRGFISKSLQLAEEPSLWWPSGYGNQAMYNISITIKDAQNATIESITREIGFRTIVLDQQPITPAEIALGIAPGSRWNFEINGHRIYIKGSNFLPPDPFWVRVTEEEIKNLFDSVIEAHMNMLRLWGGAAYPPEWVLSLADSMGILVWHEFGFSDAIYPTSTTFLSSISLEATHQVRLANTHPSTAVWSGGNEIEVLVDTVIEEGLPISSQAHYEALFNVLLPAVFENSRAVSFMPSSVTNGYLEYEYEAARPFVERYLNATPGELYGSTDYYNYTTTDAFNTSYYPTGRFAVEFGIHSMPSVHTWSTYIPASDLFFNSTSILAHNHHYPSNISSSLDLDAGNQTFSSLGGMGQMTIAAQNYYPTPPFNDSSLANFTAWIYTTQVFQAEFVRAQVNYYRVGSAKRERQLGTMYWQLNDVWAAPTWAGIEKGGRWKMLHYTAKDFFSSVIIAPQFDADKKILDVWVVSDLWEGVEGMATVEWLDWSGKVLNTTTLEVGVGAINATNILSTDLSTTSFDLANAVARLSVEVKNEASSTNFTHEAWFHPTPLKDQKMIDPGLSLRFDNTTSEFFVQAEKGVAAFVWLDHPKGVEGHFEDNGFWLAPGGGKSVGFKINKDRTAGMWIEDVNVRSLWDNNL